ncbi:MAG: putative manganese transporter [Armatimonadota bacterium]
MIEVLEEAVHDSLKLFPFLLGAYVLVAVLEYRFGDAISKHILKAGKAGPLLGALFGSIPQCGFSVMGSALYARRLVTMGTLLAVFIATSDEAVPMILSQPEKIGWLLPIIGAKVVLAIIAGYGVDLVLRLVRPRQAMDDQHAAEAVEGEASHQHTTVAAAAEVAGDTHHQQATLTAVPPEEHAHDEPEVHEHEEIDEVLREHGCCDHHIAGGCPRKPSPWSSLLWHPLQHTAKVFIFIFLVTLALGYLAHRYEDAMSGLLLPRHLLLQPVLTALVGLIPNCAASVAITQLLIEGKITFGAAMAGLTTSAGVGLLVLLKENRSRRNTLLVLALLLAIGITAGILLQVLLPRFPAL